MSQSEKSASSGDEDWTGSSSDHDLDSVTGQTLNGGPKTAQGSVDEATPMDTASAEKVLTAMKRKRTDDSGADLDRQQSAEVTTAKVLKSERADQSEASSVSTVVKRSISSPTPLAVSAVPAAVITGLPSSSSTTPSSVNEAVGSGPDSSKIVDGASVVSANKDDPDVRAPIVVLLC